MTVVPDEAREPGPTQAFEYDRPEDDAGANKRNKTRKHMGGRKGNNANLEEETSSCISILPLPVSVREAINAFTCLVAVLIIHSFLP